MESSNLVTLHVERARVHGSRFRTGISSVVSGVLIPRSWGVHLNTQQQIFTVYSNKICQCPIKKNRKISVFTNTLTPTNVSILISLGNCYTRAPSLNGHKMARGSLSAVSVAPLLAYGGKQWPWHAGHGYSLNPGAQWALPLAPRTPVTLYCFGPRPLPIALGISSRAYHALSEPTYTHPCALHFQHAHNGRPCSMWH